LVLPINVALAHTGRVGAFDAAALGALAELLGRPDVERRVAQGRFDPTLKELLTAEGLPSRAARSSGTRCAWT
jgi:hypothetical protein